MKFVVFLSLIAALLLVQAQKPDYSKFKGNTFAYLKNVFRAFMLKFAVNGHYVFERQSNFENFLRASGITDEDKIAKAAGSKPELFMEKVGPNVTITFVESPTFNATLSFIEGEEYNADFLGVGKAFKVSGYRKMQALYVKIF